MRSTKLAVTMFFFCILSAAEKITSSINKDFGKCSSQSFSVRHELSEFHTHQFKSFQNSKYLAVAFSTCFIKVAKSTSCLSSLYMLRNVLIVKLAKLYTVNLYFFQLCTRSGMCLLLNWQHCTL